MEGNENISQSGEISRKRVKQLISEMSMMNDLLMSMVLEHKECMELVLRIILNKDDLVVTKCKSQYTITNLRGRSACLDALASDSEGKLYNIEVQRSDTKDLPQRARYNGSLIDSRFVKKGSKFKTLPERYVIFITESDIFNRQKPLYTVTQTIAETGEPYNDGSHTIFVNSSIQNDTPLGKLMMDFHSKDPDKMNYEAILKQINYYKNGKGNTHMCRLMESFGEEMRKVGREEGREEGIIKGKKQQAISIALLMLSKNTYTYEEISELTTLTVTEIEELDKKTSA